MNCIVHLLLAAILIINVYVYEAKPALRADDEQDENDLGIFEKLLDYFKTQIASLQQNIDAGDINGVIVKLGHLADELKTFQSALAVTSDEVNEILKEVQDSLAQLETKLKDDLQRHADGTSDSNEEPNDEDENDDSEDNESQQESNTTATPENSKDDDDNNGVTPEQPATTSAPEKVETTEDANNNPVVRQEKESESSEEKNDSKKSPKLSARTIELLRLFAALNSIQK